MLRRPGGKLSARAECELAQNVADVDLHRMLRKPQGIADLSVTETLSDQYGYLPFTRRDAAELLGLGWAVGAACV